MQGPGQPVLISFLGCYLGHLILFWFERLKMQHSFQSTEMPLPFCVSPKLSSYFMNVPLRLSSKVSE